MMKKMLVILTLILSALAQAGEIESFIKRDTVRESILDSIAAHLNSSEEGPHWRVGSYDTLPRLDGVINDPWGDPVEFFVVSRVLAQGRRSVTLFECETSFLYDHPRWKIYHSKCKYIDQID